MLDAVLIEAIRNFTAASIPTLPSRADDRRAASQELPKS
jgi:hypothetical protein